MLGKAATILCLVLSGCAASHELQIGWDRTGNGLVEIGQGFSAVCGLVDQS